MIQLIFIFLGFSFSENFAASILLHTRDAVVWHPEQKITGELSGFEAEEIIVHHNQNFFRVDVLNGTAFSFKLLLKERINKIWVEVPDKPGVASDTVFYTLGYKPLPIIKPIAAVNGDKAILHAVTVENIYNAPIQYLWVPDSLNPAALNIINKEDSIASAEIPDVAGIYNFSLLVVVDKDSSWYQTFIKKNKKGIQPFDIESDYPLWMDDAIIYQITPYAFVEYGTFDAITAKLHELKVLGINTIWLQPVFESFYGEQGYDVTNYLSVNPAMGTEKQLQHLIERAKALEIRVLFDIVLNHTAIQHPYAKDRIKYGVNSHYYDFYQHKFDRKPYSSFYNSDEYGFINYFWKDLVNLNYQNKEVRRWMLEVCKYWVKEFDIDGYRFDAIWGVNARRPSFAERLRIELKSIKPDVLLLAEDKGSVPKVYELGFDAAYDWTTDTTWVSQWPWEYEYHVKKSHTIFNFPKTDERGEMLSRALFHNGGNAHRKLYYMENNDLPRFIKAHGLKRTKMAAALLFSLPGIPMLYNGQEVGFREHPYSATAIFKRDSSIQALDETGLFDYYQKLIEMHKQYPALSDTAMQEIHVSKGAMVAFHRWKDKENFIIVVNMDSASAAAKIDIRKAIPDGTRPRKYRLCDKLADDVFKVRKDPSQVKIPMEGYSVRWLQLKKK